MNNTLGEKDRHLGEILSRLNRVIVAFSGGIDSAFLLKRAQQELGDQVAAVVVASELFRKEEYEKAVQLAMSMGVKVYEIEIKELENPAIVENTPDSWYHSKKMLYSQINKLAEEENYPYVLDGMIMDDINDFRPGLKARTEANVRSVLQEARLYKHEIRTRAKQLGLSVWDKPASCSLASRIPYGVHLDKQKIKQVEQAESYLSEQGYSNVRVRHHGDTARIEVAPTDMVKLIQNREQVHEQFMYFGFSYVALDLLGYRTGSMNETLSSESIEKYHEKISI